MERMRDPAQGRGENEGNLKVKQAMGLKGAEGKLGMCRAESRSPARPGRGNRLPPGKDRGRDRNQRSLLEMWTPKQVRKVARTEEGAEKQPAERPQVCSEEK